MTTGILLTLAGILALVILRWQRAHATTDSEANPNH